MGSLCQIDNVSRVLTVSKLRVSVINVTFCGLLEGEEIDCATTFIYSTTLVLDCTIVAKGTISAEHTIKVFVLAVLTTTLNEYASVLGSLNVVIVCLL